MITATREARAVNSPSNVSLVSVSLVLSPVRTLTLLVKSPAGVSHAYSKVRVPLLDLHPSQTQNHGSFLPRKLFSGISAAIPIFTRHKLFSPTVPDDAWVSVHREKSLVDGDLFDLIFRYGRLHSHHASIDCPPVAYSLTGHLQGRNGSSDGGCDAEICTPFD